MLWLPLGNSMHITVQYKWAQLLTVRRYPWRTLFLHTFSAVVERRFQQRGRCRHIKNRARTTVEVILLHKAWLKRELEAVQAACWYNAFCKVWKCEISQTGLEERDCTSDSCNLSLLQAQCLSNEGPNHAFYLRVHFNSRIYFIALC